MLRGRYALTVEVFAAELAGGEAVNGLKLVLTTDRTEVRAGKLGPPVDFDRIKFNLSFVNASGERIRLNAFPTANLRLNVAGEDAGKVRSTRSIGGYIPTPKAADFPAIEPQESFDCKGNLGFPDFIPGMKEFEVAAPGTYRLSVTYSNTGDEALRTKLFDDKAWTGTVTSNEIVIKVLPPEGAGAEKLPVAGAPDEATAQRLATEFLRKETSEEVRIRIVADERNRWCVLYQVGAPPDPKKVAIPPGGFPSRSVLVDKQTGAVKHDTRSRL